MRGLYRGLVEVRALKLAPRGAEACFVAACLDLHEGDFAFSTAGPRAAAYVRELGARAGKAEPRAAGVRGALAEAEERFAGTAPEGLFCAAGAAMALALGSGDAAALALLGGKAAAEALWVKVLRATRAAELPLVTVALPDRKGADWSSIGRKAGVPVIPVDAADAVALYRVAQESIGRARADRRGAVIECVATGADPVRLMAEQLVAKGIANRRWVQAVDESFTKLLGAVTATRTASARE